MPEFIALEDELSALAQRAGDGNNFEQNRQLKTEIDGLIQRAQVILAAIERKETHIEETLVRAQSEERYALFKELQACKEQCQSMESDLAEMQRVEDEIKKLRIENKALKEDKQLLSSKVQMLKKANGIRNDKTAEKCLEGKKRHKRFPIDRTAPHVREEIVERKSKSR